MYNQNKELLLKLELLKVRSANHVSFCFWLLIRGLCLDFEILGSHHLPQHYKSDQLKLINTNGSSYHELQQRERLQICRRGYKRAVQLWKWPSTTWTPRLSSNWLGWQAKPHAVVTIARLLSREFIHQQYWQKGTKTWIYVKYVVLLLNYLLRQCIINILWHLIVLYL